MISVITATYNRENKLTRLYESLKRQNNRNFEWIVIDDGSTDNTKELILKFIDENSIDIKYEYKVNGGKHTAVNLGIKLAKGDMITFVDSDDYLIDDAIDFYETSFEKIRNDYDIIGVSGIKINQDGEIVGCEQNSPIYATYFEFRYSMGIIGDRAEAYKSDIIKKYSFPEFENERFVTEAVLYNRISENNGKILWDIKPTVICEYTENGLTAQGGNLFLNSWKGYSLYVKEFIKYKQIPIKNKVRIFIAYLYKGMKHKKSVMTVFKIK